MHPTRREIMRLITAGASATALGSAMPETGSLAAQTPHPAAEPGFDPSGVSFWTDLFQTRPSGSRGVPTDDRFPRFIVFTPDQGFRFTISPPIKVSELESFEQPSIKLRVMAFKPSDEDARKFDASQSGTLRVDLLQSGTLNVGAAGTSASTAMAGLATSGSKLQPSSVSGVSIGGEESFTLPEGGGYLNWTYFLQKKNALWHKVLSALLLASKSAVTSFLPILNIGPIAKSDWNGVNSMLGGLLPANESDQTAAAKTSSTANSSTSWIFTPGLVPFAASQKAYQDPMFSDGIPLIKGAHYVVVPQEHFKAFGDAMSGMKLTESGYVVPQNTPEQDEYDVAYSNDALKSVTYLALHCEQIDEAKSACPTKTP
jgi:hypothetical protein